MSVGQIHIMASFVNAMTKTGLANLWATNSIKVGFVTSALTPSITDSDARWGAGGAQNYSTSEVAAGGNYTAGGIALAGNTITQAGATTSLNATSPLSIAAHASNPTNAAWGIIYDNTDAGKRVLGFIDLGGTVSLVPGYILGFNGGQLSGVQPVFQSTAT